MKKDQLKKQYNLTENQFLGIDKIGGSLDLSNLTSIPEGFNPTVGGSLYLGNLTCIPEGFNPKNFDNKNLTKISWLQEKYIKVDGIFTEVLNKKGNIYKVKKLNNPKEFYLITDGEGKWSHGDSLQEAKQDLIYKISNRRKEDYSNLNLYSILTFENAIECYRVITGACSLGTKDFVASNNIEVKDYSINEMIKLTKGKYGNENFIQFFN
jgi:hypothetical protein